MIFGPLGAEPLGGFTEGILVFSIASTAAFGTASLRPDVAPTAIASAEAVSNPSVGEAATYLPVSRV